MPKFASDFRAANQSDFTRRYRNPNRHENQYVYRSVTNITGALPKTALLNWYALTVAKTAVTQLKAWESMESPDDQITWLKQAPLRARDKAGNRGTVIHAVIDKMLRGERYDVEGIEDWIDAAQKFMDDMRPKPLATESTIYDERSLTAGTFDYLGHLGALPEWGLTLLDWKTSKGIYSDMAVQLIGGYALGAQYSLSDDAEETEWQTPDTCAIVHFTQDGYAVRPVPMDRIFRRAFLGAVEIRKWEEEAPKIGDPIQLRLPVESASSRPAEAEIADARRRIAALDLDKKLALSADLTTAGIPTKIAELDIDRFDKLLGLLKLYETGEIAPEEPDTRRGRSRAQIAEVRNARRLR